MPSKQLKEQSLYRDLARGAWEISWHQRGLWPLGLLASLLMMNGGAFEFIVRAFFKISSGAPFSGGVSFIQALPQVIQNTDPTQQLALLFSAILVVALAVIVVIAAVGASGGLLHAVERKLAKRPVGYRRALSVGLEKFWPLLLTQIVGRVAIFTIFVLAALGAYAAMADASSVTLAIMLFVIFAVAALIITFLMMMTNCGVMIGRERWINAAHDAGRFLRRHWLISIEMMGLLLAVAAGTALGTVLLALVLLIPFTLLLFAVSALNVSFLFAGVVYLFGLVMIVVALAVGSWLATFGHAAWGLLYLRLADRGAISKLERLWQKIRRK